MKFEWDENKNQSNIEKHGINFEEATQAFNDKDYIKKFDRVVGTEKRTHIIGKILNVVVALVVYTERNNNIRIISARRASKKERGLYYGKQK